MKRKWLKHLIASIICAVVAVVFEILIFNIHTLPSDNTNKITEVSFSTDTDNKETTVTIDPPKSYINKLLINYTASKDIPYTLTYSYPDTYNNTATDATINDIFDDSFSTSILNINQDASKLIIKYQTTDSLSINNIKIDNAFHFNHFRAIFIFLVLSLMYCLFIFYRAGFKTERLHLYFAIVCTILGLMFIVAQPIATFYSWDDQIHFGAIVDWPGGHIPYSNGEYHSTDANVLNSAGKFAINSSEEKQQQADLFNSDATNTYAKDLIPLPRVDQIHYLPMSIGYNLAKILHLPFTVCFILGKIFNLIAYVILISYAIKITKIGKRLISFIALIPINVFLASNYSYDPAVLAGITVFFVQVVNYYIDKESKVDFKTTLIMIASITYACFAKAVYAPFLLLTLLIPKTSFRSSEQCRLAKIFFSILMLLLLALPLFNGGTASDPRGGHTSVKEQASLIFSHPLEYTNVLNKNAGTQLLPNFIGNSSTINYAYMGDSTTTPNLYILLIAFLIFFFITDNFNNKLKAKHRITILSISSAIIILIWTALYLSFNEVGATIIKGVQGRYFLPLLLPILLSLQPKHIKNSIPPKTYNLLSLLIPSVILIASIYSIILLPYSF